jgi:sec-independent protein translocase protein TatA
MGLKGMEILLIFGVLLLLFGATRLPQLGSSLGSAIRNFKKGFNTDSAEAEADKPAGGTLAAASGTEAAAKDGAKAGVSRDA